MIDLRFDSDVQFHKGLVKKDGRGVTSNTQGIFQADIERMQNRFTSETHHTLNSPQIEPIKWLRLNTILSLAFHTSA